MIVGLIVVVVLVLIIFGMYNGLIRKKNGVDLAFGSIDAQLKKRYDLIPNLVSTVKQYAQHEKELLENITELRSKAMNPDMSNDEKVALDNQVSQTLRGIMVAVENYPDLKANQNFIHLQQTLNEVESQISAARRSFNSAVTDYNNAIQSIPQNIMASMMKLQTKKVFDIPEK